MNSPSFFLIPRSSRGLEHIAPMEANKLGCERLSRHSASQPAYFSSSASLSSCRGLQLTSMTTSSSLSRHPRFLKALARVGYFADRMCRCSGNTHAENPRARLCSGWGICRFRGQSPTNRLWIHVHMFLSAIIATVIGIVVVICSPQDTSLARCRLLLPFPRRILRCTLLQITRSGNLTTITHHHS